MTDRVGGCIGAAPRLDLAVDVGYMALDRVSTDAKAATDRLIGFARRHQPEHLDLPTAQSLPIG